MILSYITELPTASLSLHHRLKVLRLRKDLNGWFKFELVVGSLNSWNLVPDLNKIKIKLNFVDLVEPLLLIFSAVILPLFLSFSPSLSPLFLSSFHFSFPIPFTSLFYTPLQRIIIEISGVFTFWNWSRYNPSRATVVRSTETKTTVVSSDSFLLHRSYVNQTFISS